MRRLQAQRVRTPYTIAGTDSQGPSPDLIHKQQSSKHAHISQLRTDRKRTLPEGESGSVKTYNLGISQLTCVL
jgi:hypothetical protein